MAGVLGITLDPWQCDVLDALMEAESVAIRSAHGLGKTVALATAAIHFATTRPFPKVVMTAPTFNKQVRDVMWAEMHHLWRGVESRWPWLFRQFVINQTRFQHVEYPTEWFAVGIASSKAVNMEGYHAEHVLVVFDEAKGIPAPAWQAVYGTRTTHEAKLLVASTPGGPTGEFFKVFTKLRSTWKHTFVIHPALLQPLVGVPEVMGQDPVTKAPVRGRYSKTGGTYYSTRPRPEWIDLCREEWGEDSPVFIARVIGNFPTLEGDNLIPYDWLARAESLEEGAPGRRVVACDVARYGRDRTTFLVLDGGTALHGETIARTPAESTAPETHTIGTGADPKRPLYRSTVVTADVCARLRREWNADVIVADETGLGGGVVDDLKRRGEPVIPLNFGAAPTDRPLTTEDRQWKLRRHLVDTLYKNLKAEMAWALRRGFEGNGIALGQLRDPRGDAYGFLAPLIAQTSLVKQDYDAQGRLCIVDPDEQDEYAEAAGNLEGKKSPDHFHALLLGWWVAGGGYRRQIPRAAAVLPPGLSVFGEPTTQIGRITAGPTGGGVGGQAGRVERWYRR